MNMKQIRLKLRNKINAITGKQALIDEYNALALELCGISDKTPCDSPLKKYLRENLDRITEAETIYTEHGCYISDYNPYSGKKIVTQQKIEDLKSTLYAVRLMQSRMH